MRVKLSSLIFLLWGLNYSNAQEIGFSGNLYPESDFVEDNVTGNNTFSHFNVYAFFNEYPVEQKKSWFTHKVDYDFLDNVTTQKVMEISSEEDFKLHALSYGLRNNRTLNSKWQMSIGVNPVLASDFEENISVNDLLMTVDVSFARILSKNLQYGFGLAYTNRFGDDLILPVGFFNYKRSKMHLQIILPQKISLLFNNTKNTFQYGVEGIIKAWAFNIEDRVTTDKVLYRSFDIGSIIKTKLTDNLQFNISGGMALGRTWKFVDENIKTTTDLSSETRLFINTGLVLKLKKN